MCADIDHRPMGFPWLKPLHLPLQRNARSAPRLAEQSDETDFLVNFKTKKPCSCKFHIFFVVNSSDSRVNS